MARIAINGLGRIGKLLLRNLIDGGDRVVLVNDPAGDAAGHALWLEFDSVQGRWTTPVAAAGEDGLVIGGQEVRLTQERRIEALPLAETGVDLVADCTGVFKTAERLVPYLAAGAGRVVVSAPVKDPGVLNIVFGVNDHLYDGTQKIVTAASCTTNCLAPVVKVIHEALGIRHGSITTIHDVTNTQTIVDRPARDPRRARAALTNLIPTTTGSATAIGLIFPDLAGRLNGHAVRVPLLNASLTDCVFEVERPTSETGVNDLFAAAAEGPLRGILGVETRPLVSSDFCGDPRSAIIDAPSTMVTGGTQVKVYAWYDNEWAYACRMADILRLVGRGL
jgi:glyceraldehyde 3-phosphate dehydrogenase